MYGVVGLKTHAKMLLVVAARGAARLRRYAHLRHRQLPPAHRAALHRLRPAHRRRRDLRPTSTRCSCSSPSLARPTQLKRLLQAPFTLHRQLLAADRARDARRRATGKPARIIAKMNALTDEPRDRGAVRARRRPACEIDLIVRGACTLRPGVPGVSDNIRVRSIVGRFLEHSRVLYFRWGDGDDDEAVYLSSADWMGRNLFRRIEVALPVRDPALRQRVIDECLVPYLHDSQTPGCCAADGSYQRVARRRARQRAAGADAALCRRAGRHLNRSSHGPDPLAPCRSRTTRDGQRDLERALTPKGERQAERMAAWLDRRLLGAFDAHPGQPGAALPADGAGARPQVQDGRGARARRDAPRRCSRPRAGPTRASRCWSSATSRRSAWSPRGCSPASISRGR